MSDPTGVAKVLLELTPDEARYVEELLEASDGELAPAVLSALAYADTVPELSPGRMPGSHVGYLPHGAAAFSPTRQEEPS